MSCGNGRSLVLLGFALNLLVTVIHFLDIVVLHLSSPGSIMYIIMNTINLLLDYGQLFSIGIAAFGFLLLWLSDRELIDLLSCGVTGIAALVGLLSGFGFIRVHSLFVSIIISAISSSFYIVLALRAKSFNRLISLLLVCAFIYQCSNFFIINFLYQQIGFPLFPTLLIRFVGFAICAGICLIEVKMED